jgi:HAD superfamily hydrolase (TIGR01509 family)
VTGGTARAVVFDFDGVLADTERLHLLAFQDVFAPRGWHLDEATYYAQYLGFDDRGLVAAFARARQMTLERQELEAITEAKARRFAERLGEGQALFPTAAACLARMAARYRLAIASGALGSEIRFILDAAGIQPAFQAIVGANDVARGKPAPDAYIEATRRLAVEPGRAVAVEDSTWGLESARTAGLRTIGITTSYPAASLAAADVVIATLDELTVELVDELTGGR